MLYLITQIFLLLLIAALLGLVLGWYLTRISGSAERETLLSRAQAAEDGAHDLRRQLKTALSERGGMEGERNALTREIADLKAQLDDEETQIGVDNAEMVSLQAELEDCRAALKAAQDMPAPATAARAKAPKPSADADDLQRIKGIGPKIAGLLNGLGINQFAQIASWGESDIAWVNERLKFKGRIERELWIEQARELSEG